jgi:molecular chaperone GrpE
MSEQPKDERAPDENAAGNEQAVKSEYAQAGGLGGGAGREGQQGQEDQEGEKADYEALMRLLKENEELKEARLRAAADMENLRKRTARDVHDARTYAIANFARDMLQVSDNLRRALEAIPADGRQKDSGLAALAEGVEMTERAMLAALERHGVSKIEAEGARFDPNLHQAMFEVPNPDVPAGTVVQVVQTGYIIGDRVLRPAMVGVSKGGPKVVEAEPAAEPGPPNPQAEKDA